MKYKGFTINITGELEKDLIKTTNFSMDEIYNEIKKHIDFIINNQKN
jgi:hypothetical protein